MPPSTPSPLMATTWPNIIRSVRVLGNWDDIDWNDGRDKDGHRFMDELLHNIDLCDNFGPSNLEKVARAGFSLDGLGRRRCKALVKKSPTSMVHLCSAYSNVRPVPHKIIEILLVYTRTHSIERFADKIGRHYAYTLYVASLKSGWRWPREASLTFIDYVLSGTNIHTPLELFGLGVSLFVCDEMGVEAWKLYWCKANFDKRAVSKIVRIIVALSRSRVWSDMPVQYQRLLVDTFVGRPSFRYP